MIQQVLGSLRAPGARAELQYSAPTQLVFNSETELVDPERSHDGAVENVDAYLALVKPRLLDRWLDRVVELSGSGFIYFTILVGLFVWAFLGIPYGSNNTYKILISDAQAIINLVFDAFLMRQQFNLHDNLLMVSGCLRSRVSSHKRMLRHLIANGTFAKIDSIRFQELQQADFMGQLPEENWLTKLSGVMSAFLGHILAVIGFWICIFVWIGFGPYCGWSNTWQLYINSATSALMVFMLAFLAHVRERHTDYSIQCLKAIWKADSALELRLRMATGDKMENPVIIIPERNRSRIQRAIDYYADLVGTLAGVAILGIIIITWVACGPALDFNANWWLLIGTYAGLVGLNDGFVLRNICQVLGDYEDEQFGQLNYEDLDTLAVIGVGTLKDESITDQSLSYRMSIRIGYICSLDWAVVFGVILIFGLIIGASVMRWSVTGQLLCNIPPSIIESFFTLILITGHNVGEAKRRVDLFNIYMRRLKLVSYVDSQNSAKTCEEVKGIELTECGVELR
ncbi:putative low affinity iron transporter [Periconia macrospinosa]|uniref:Putative low affinity iron transporter n=1 Tax=Periconia macrospinosa TaxID=97972 RepID=A0A2V1D7C1_9PLEO|nr:putative low affinity iron transporter [Periconia macrospinosa]